MPAVPSDPFGLIGQLLDGQYRVDTLAGEGGFSAVYRGTHVGLGEPIAIKCMKISSALAHVAAALGPTSQQGPSTPVMNSVVVDQFVKRFRDEGRILYKLSQGNLNVVRCLASGTTTAPATGALVPYLVLEWLEGRSLQDDLESRGARGRTLAETMALLEPAFDAIGYAHGLGVVHRDLSTGNVFLARGPDGSTRAKVLDFGVAKVMTDDLDIGPRTQTLAQIRIYSPAYAAPEQFDAALGSPGPYTDVHSLAMVAVEVLVGRGVRTGETLGQMMQQALDPSWPRTPRALGAVVPDAVEQVFARALAFEPARRHRDVAELWRELRAASGAHLGSTAPHHSPGAHDMPPATQRLPSAPPPGPAFQSFKETVRMPSAPPPPRIGVPTPPPAPANAAPAPPQANVGLVPPAAPSASQLFQPPALPPPPGAFVPEATGSLPALQVPRSAAPPPAMAPMAPMAPRTPFAGAPANALPRRASARPAPAGGGSARSQWLVGLIVFVVVLGAGAVALRVLLWK
jgi:serine/threonine protein kinase